VKKTICEEAKMKHRQLIRVMGAMAALVLAFPAAAQAPYPAKPIRFLVGFPPGGTNDIVARVLTPKLTEYLGQSVIVENRGGANASIAADLGARAAPDGYTIMLVAPGHATNPWLLKLNFDSIKDFAFITQAAESQNLLVVHPSFPPKSVKELIAFSKKRAPGSINYGSSGTGTTVHLSAELFQFMTGVKWLHIPYKGGGPAVVDLLAGQHVIYFGNVPTVITHARAGKLRALAVTGPKRTPAAADIPTIAESGIPGYEVTTAYGVAAPAKTPRPIIDRLHSEIVRTLKSPDTRERLQSLGADPVGNTPEQYTAFIQNDTAKWGKVIKAAGIKGE
jgi:tripartite-type tricarboxylate transporter receptor subunit TctC